MDPLPPFTAFSWLLHPQFHSHELCFLDIGEDSGTACIGPQKIEVQAEEETTNSLHKQTVWIHRGDPPVTLSGVHNRESWEHQALGHLLCPGLSDFEMFNQVCQ